MRLLALINFFILSLTVFGSDTDTQSTKSKQEIREEVEECLDELKEALKDEKYFKSSTLERLLRFRENCKSFFEDSATDLNTSEATTQNKLYDTGMNFGDLYYSEASDKPNPLSNFVNDKINQLKNSLGSPSPASKEEEKEIIYKSTNIPVIPIVLAELPVQHETVEPDEIAIQEKFTEKDPEIPFEQPMYEEYKDSSDNIETSPKAAGWGAKVISYVPSPSTATAAVKKIIPGQRALDAATWVPRKVWGYMPSFKKAPSTPTSVDKE